MAHALALAPNHRLIVRSAARLAQLLGSPDESLWLFSRLEATRTDPWLMAAEIAYSSLVDERPMRIRAARAIMSSGDFSDFELSELAAAIATVELENGHDRKSRQLFRRALREPTRNTISQATWANQNHTSTDSTLAATLLPIAPSAAEAYFTLLIERQDWQGAMYENARWLRGEPFDVRGAIAGANLAGVALDDWQRAQDLIDAVRLQRYQSTEYLLSAAYVYGSSGRVRDAVRMLGTIHVPNLVGTQFVVYTANLGLLSYRAGEHEQGRQHYGTAIRLARANEALAKGITRSALAHHLREELRVQGPQVAAIREQLNSTKPAEFAQARVIEPLIARLNQAP